MLTNRLKIYFWNQTAIESHANVDVLELTKTGWVKWWTLAIDIETEIQNLYGEEKKTVERNVRTNLEFIAVFTIHISINKNKKKGQQINGKVDE